MVRNTSSRPSNTRRSNTPVRLSNRGCGVAALAASALIVTASLGHVGAAALGAVALYLLVSGRAAAVARIIPTAKQSLRGIAWVVAAVAAVMALQGSHAAGGPTLGLALAAALATYLKLSQRR